MKEIWVLSVRTSLPYTCENFSEMEPEFAVFESFESARAAFRAKIKELAFSKNAMFDGKGRLTQFEEYADDLDDDEDEDDEDGGFLNQSILTKILSALTAAIRGADTKLELKDGFYTNYSIAVDVKDGSVNFYGFDDGPYNGYDPKLYTNIFSMKEPSDYYFYADDRLGQSCATAELYIDLKKAMIDF